MTIHSRFTTRNNRATPIGRVSWENSKASSGLSLMELLVGMSITAIVLPGLLNLMLEPLLSQLRITALSAAEGNANLLALKARKAGEVNWDPTTKVLSFDGKAYPLPEGCSITGSNGALSANCSNGQTVALQHSTSKDLLSQHPCQSELFPFEVPDVEACRQAID